MTRNEQIKEIARTICGLNTDKGCFCDGGYCNYNCLAYEKAKDLYAKGYRKASEVAHEVIADIRQSLLNMVLLNIMGEEYDLAKAIADVEKKYTESEVTTNDEERADSGDGDNHQNGIGSP